MASVGDVIEHPVTGERITFLETARETCGRCVRLERAVAAGGGRAVHVHQRQEEAFEVRSGVVTLVAHGDERRIGPGEGAVVPAGTPHGWMNLEREPAVVVVEFRPALNTEECFESFFGLAQDGKVDTLYGMPVQPWLALLALRYRDELVHLAEPPSPSELPRMTVIAAEAAGNGLRLPYPYPYAVALTGRRETA